MNYVLAVLFGVWLGGYLVLLVDFGIILPVKGEINRHSCLKPPYKPSLITSVIKVLKETIVWGLLLIIWPYILIKC